MKQPKAKTSHRFGGELWRIRRRRLRTDWGQCDSDSREIFIHAGASGYDLLEFLIHEAWHAVDHELDEDAVTQHAADLAGLLWKYRDEIFDD